MFLVSTILAKIAPNTSLSHTLFPPASEFDPARDVPDLTGKTVIVTGSDTGIGYQIVLQLLLKNAKVYLTALSPSEAQDAAERLEKATGRKPLQLELDLGDLHSVRRAAQEFLSKEDKLDILFNNAGVMIPPVTELTRQGYDLRTSSAEFGVNLLGHYYFTMLLLPALERSTTTSGVKARVVNTSSSGHIYAAGNGMEFSAFKGGPERDAKIKEWGLASLPGVGAEWYFYGFSKLGNIMFTHLLNRYHAGQLESYTLHPGGISSGIQRYGSAFERAVSRIILHPEPYGALTPLWAGTMPEARKAVGVYLIPWCRIGQADPRASNEKLQDELLAYLEKQVADFLEKPI